MAVVHTHQYSPLYLAERGLLWGSVEVAAVPGGYVFTVTTDGPTDESNPNTQGPFASAGGEPFGSLESALLLALQYHEYPDVTDYVAS